MADQTASTLSSLLDKVTPLQSRVTESKKQLLEMLKESKSGEVTSNGKIFRALKRTSTPTLSMKRLQQLRVEFTENYNVANRELDEFIQYIKEKQIEARVDKYSLQVQNS